MSLLFLFFDFGALWSVYVLHGDRAFHGLRRRRRRSWSDLTRVSHFPFFFSLIATLRRVAYGSLRAFRRERERVCTFFTGHATSHIRNRWDVLKVFTCL